jgi:hypothetical protein
MYQPLYGQRVMVDSWEIWTATLAQNPADYQVLIDPIYKFINETPKLWKKWSSANP